MTFILKTLLHLIQPLPLIWLVLGIWLADQYRNSFAQEIGANGIDGLIKALADKNKKALAAPAKKA